MKSSNIETFENKYYIYILSSALIFQSINNFAKSLSDLFSVSEQTFSLFVYIVYICLYTYWILKGGLKQTIQVIESIVVYLLIILISYMLFEDTQSIVLENLLSIRQIVIFYLPAFTVLLNFKDWKEFFIKFKKFAYLSIILSLFSLVISDVMNYMELAPQLLPSAMVLYFNFLKQRRMTTLIFFGISLVTIFFAGNRMSLFSVFLYMFLVYIFTYVNFKKVSSWISTFVITGLMLIIVSSWKFILNIMIYILDSFNMGSRTLRLIVSGDVTDLGFRQMMYNAAWKILETLNYEGQGLFSDRLYLRKIWPDVAYVHNLFLELLFDLGLYVTIAIVIILLFKIFRVFIKSKSKYKIALFLVLLCITIPRLMVSGSYIIEGYFILFLGILFNNIYDSELDSTNF